MFKMKKLILNRVTFAGAEVLSRAQLKKVMGGSGETTTGSGCTSSSQCMSNDGCPQSGCPNCSLYSDTGTDMGYCGK
jgi:hypothetical protein